MRSTLLLCSFLVASLAIFTSNSSGVSSSFDATGSPLANRACTSCHSGGSFDTETSIKLLDANGIEQTNYLAGELYTVEISYTATGSPSAFGFQAVLLDSFNNQAGQLGAAPTGTRIRQRSGIDYFDHTQRQTGNSISIEWTAPTFVGTGDVNIYAAVNAVDGTGGTRGDSPDEGSLTVSEMIAPPAVVYQPRNLADLRGVDAMGIPDSLGALVEVEGLVYGPDSEPSVSNFNLLTEDGSAGIAVLNYSDSLNYEASEGQRVLVRGTLSQVVGLTYIEAVELEVLDTRMNPLPREVFVDVLDETLEGRFVRMMDLQMVDPNEWQQNPTSTYDIRFVTPLGDTLIAQIAEGMPVWGGGAMTFGELGFEISGIVRQFDTEDPLLDGYYILPRYIEDLRELVVSTKEINDFEFTVTRFGESINVEAPSPIQSVSLVGLDGRVIHNQKYSSGQQLVNFPAPSGKTPLQAVWVQLTDGRNKAVFVR